MGVAVRSRHPRVGHVEQGGLPVVEVAGRLEGALAVAVVKGRVVVPHVVAVGDVPGADDVLRYANSSLGVRMTTRDNYMLLLFLKIVQAKVQYSRRGEE